MKKTISLRVSVPMYKNLHELSREAGVSLSAYIEKRLICDDNQLQVRNILDRMDLIISGFDGLKLGSGNIVILEFLKEISIHLDSRIPSLVKARLIARGAIHE